ncbi:hypothetical protein R1CP_36300 (plasmid) [Rhodococcus opacus]|uniref:Uncharacterized protein n=1 Tax=Rhodococcus opacus TaxID=37919 RepID=A0A1B1KGY2_RHOOP|nr:hypothetical protein R1CP_36300 [Rhodococcus opacus]
MLEANRTCRVRGASRGLFLAGCTALLWIVFRILARDWAISND